MNQLSKAMSLENITAILELDKTFTIQHLTSPTDFTISSEDGSLLKNDPYGLSCLIENIYVEQEEENVQHVEIDGRITFEDEEDEDEEETELYSSINHVDFLNNKGYQVICESPLEISLIKTPHSFASMFFANLIYCNLVAQS